MNDLAMNPLFVASAGLAGAGLVVALLLRLCRIHSPLWHRLGWGIVLAQGVLIISIPVSLPVLEARTPAPGWGDASQNEWRADLLAMDGARPAVAGNEIAAGVESRADSQRRISMATVYLAGLLLALVIQAGAYGALCLAMRRTREAPPEWQEEWKRILGERGIRNRVRLRVHDTIGPMVCRLPQGSRIVVPEQAWARLNARQRMAVLEHEAAHLLRGDVWKSFAARLVAVLHWFNPIAWWAARRFEEAAEWDCDRRLSSRGENSAVDYAKALLHFAEPRCTTVGASLARGSALQVRIRRLASGSDGSERVGRVAAFACALVLLAGVGLLRVELVAREGTMTPDEGFARRVETLLEQIEGSGDTLSRFRDALRTEPGRIVLKERVLYIEEESRERATRNALQDFLETRFEEREGTLVLKESFAGERERLVEAHATFGEDVEGLGAPMEKLRDELATESEAEKLLARFLDQDGAAPILYVAALREQMRPGAESIQEELGEILAEDGKGGLAVPVSRVERATEIARFGRAVRAAGRGIAEGLELYEGQVATPDELHRRLAAAIEDPLFPYFAATEIADDAEEVDSPEMAVDLFFAQIEEGLIEKGDGLHLTDEAIEDLPGVLGEFEAVRGRVEALRGPVADLAARIGGEDELHRELQALFESEAAVVLLARELPLGNASPEEALMAVLSEALETKKGKRRVREEAEEEVTENMRDILRHLREVRLRGRHFDRASERIGDPELAAVFGSTLGKLLIIEQIQREIESMEIDGLSRWVEETFQEDDQGRLTLRAGANEELEEIVAEAKEIGAELESDF